MSRSPAVIGALCAAALAAAGCRPAPGPARAPAPEPAPPAVLFAAATRPVPPPPRVRVARGPAGELVEVSCGTCHATTPPNPALREASALKDFHQGLQLAHGGLACLACHNRDDYDRLQLANGDAVEFPDVMALCAQCHGPQWRDYQHGAHGGMSGHWDLGRGGRLRNACVHCHDPHVPKFQAVQPAPPPADRFIPAGAGGGHA
jgi:hypothetical protein